MTNRQTLTEAEIGQMRRIAKEQADASVKSAVDQLCKDAFVGGDAHLHRVMQQAHIDKSKRWDGIGADLIKQAIIWCALACLSAASFFGLIKGGK
jgi:hypothetical protein